MAAAEGGACNNNGPCIDEARVTMALAKGGMANDGGRGVKEVPAPIIAAEGGAGDDSGHGVEEALTTMVAGKGGAGDESGRGIEEALTNMLGCAFPVGGGRPTGRRVILVDVPDGSDGGDQWGMEELPICFSHGRPRLSHGTPKVRLRYA